MLPTSSIRTGCTGGSGDDEGRDAWTGAGGRARRARRTSTSPTYRWRSDARPSCVLGPSLGSREAESKAEAAEQLAALPPACSTLIEGIFCVGVWILDCGCKAERAGSTPALSPVCGRFGAGSSPGMSGAA
eukprot:scaffold265269_cov30-Tisochrysis_lutea.AAC.4